MEQFFDGKSQSTNILWHCPFITITIIKLICFQSLLNFSSSDVPQNLLSLRMSKSNQGLLWYSFSFYVIHMLLHITGPGGAGEWIRNQGH